MTVDSVAEFSLWPSFAAADSIEADTVAAAAVGLLGGGSFTTLRIDDVSPFSMSDQSPQLGFDLAGTTYNDQLFQSAEAANTAELYALLQQQQQQQPQSSLYEQCIDAEISRLLQLKQALHRQRQQPTVARANTQPMSNSFTTAPSSCSFTVAQQHLPMSNAYAAQQSMAAAAAAAAASAAAAAAALSAATGPFCGGGLAATSGLPPAGLAGNQLAANQFAGNQLALQSALFVPVSNSSRVSMEQPALPHIPQTASFGLRAPLANRIPATRRMSLDVTACSLYSSSAAGVQHAPHVNRIPAARRMSLDVTASSLYSSSAAGLQQVGLTSAQAAWLNSAGAGNRAVSSINTSQRASFDIPLSGTPDGRCPPRKTASIVSTGSARDSPTHATGRKSATFSAEDRPGAARNSGRSGPVHQAPKWAGSHWHPMADVVKSGQIANKGTGVFIPGGLQESAS